MTLARVIRTGLFVVVLALPGCATSPLPPGYTGPTTTIHDWARQETNARVQIYFVSEVNGKPIETSVSATREANAGRGLIAYFSPKTISRVVPAGKTRLKLEGRIMYGAPIQEIVMAMTMYTIEMEIEVDLAPNERYTVMGDLSAEGREIYLVDSRYQRVGTKVSS